MKFKTIYSGVYHDSYCHPFHLLGGDIDVARTADDLRESDSLLIIWGGADINPDYYKRPMHRTTHPGGARDRVEWELIQRAIEKGITIAGVCRGAQMLCAAAGGWLIQDVRNHAGTGGHDVVTHDGQRFRVNTIHHQMMVPDDTEHELVGWAHENLSVGHGYGIATTDANGVVNDRDWWTPPANWREPEFVYFPKINGYAIQWHPEGMSENSPATQYVLNYIQRKEDERNSRRTRLFNCTC